jgi:hypothetical protein
MMSQQSFCNLLALALVAVQVAYAQFPDCANGPLKDNLVCNTAADAVSRAKALVNLLTLDEMVAHSVYNFTGIPRLGLPPYSWWNEDLVCLFLKYVRLVLIILYYSARYWKRPVSLWSELFRSWPAV